jgi:hypothetical protein
MGDLEGLKNLSQQAIQNSWYRVRFGFIPFRVFIGHVFWRCCTGF